MRDGQEEKGVVRAFQSALDAAFAVPDASRAAEALAEATARSLGAAHLFRGVDPLGEHLGPAALADHVLAPLARAFTRLHRREDIFFAGANQMDGGTGLWVVSMGHLVGLFDAPWLSIRPTGKMAFLRYASFYRVEAGRIAETAFFCDIPHLMEQAGQNPFPGQSAAHLVQPGPLTHDGLLFDAQPPEAGAATRALIDRMIADLGQWQSHLPLEEELMRNWAEDMIWWGPAGIGATYTIARYAQQHAAPFRAGFADRSPTRHVARLAEGHYGGFFGWPNFTVRPTGGFMGMPASDRTGEFRVVDIYRRAGDKLAENWVFIDFLHFWKTLGVDMLARATEPAREPDATV
ncbi:SnoaL-like domain-containing protein [Roseivivax lentus]|uniref:SnoaL-like domain-containing protein n=1 Tax=Roseivivax lentus TaxID=633194 RepID=A0A1N7LG88_9RHOB|nr:ester cyclase [Roseivivax lentus]SIS72804.1 SnoaL-like domain-containing protein [Roseivivax lentus]